MADSQNVEVNEPPRIACFATQGSRSLDEARIVALLTDLSPEALPFDYGGKKRAGVDIFQALARTRPDLVVMEGTGIAGGGAVMAARRRLGIPYVVSSGDAVGPFWGLRQRALRAPGELYERALLSMSSGFIGWSPYLVGRALSLGASHAMTAANWAAPVSNADRDSVREKLGILPDTVVFGIVGSIVWNSRVDYAYGLELVRAIRRVERPDVCVLIVGDGSGLEPLKLAARTDPRVVFVGRVGQAEVGPLLSALDIASLPQSVDSVGSFRYTTKLSEYVAAGLPIVTSRIPLAYDLDDGWIWRLPGNAPWDERFVAALARLMSEVDPAAVAERKESVPVAPAEFDLERQQRHARDFILEILDDARTARRR